jgi:heterodisulfide reductase subunit A
MTQLELEQKLYAQAVDLKDKNVVMIQCVGSRNDDRAYCSRVCCSMAVKNALKIKRQNPDANIYVLYRDIRTYGFREKYYKEAREAGVVFLRYEKANPPALSENGEMIVTLKSPDFTEPIELEADYLILSTGIDAIGSGGLADMLKDPLNEDGFFSTGTAAVGNGRLADMLKVPLNADGFFVEAHLKLRPVEFATEGIFLCGLAHSPKMMDENISQARAAASRAATVLSRPTLEVGAQVSYVDQNKCISCMTCVHICPYTAPAVNTDRKAEIISAKCMGCGICAAECPAKAIQLNHFEGVVFEKMLQELFQRRNINEIEPVKVPE